MEQHYINPEHYEKEVELLLQQLRVRHILLVCGKYFVSLPICSFITKLQKDQKAVITYFQDFTPNPKYEDVEKGVQTFTENRCDFILSVGGGSTIDMAKCIKWILERERADRIPILAVPTTAGTGSEATQFAVVYKNGVKYSIEHKNLLPEYVLLEPLNLSSLSAYQKKVTICDALAHAIESYWSVRSSDRNKRLSENAICVILKNVDDYLQEDSKCYKDLMLASNLAGRAINITRTTAAHAMSYQLTALFNIPHGHAVMLCLPEVWEYMQKKLDACIDRRGKEYLKKTLDSLSRCLGQDSPEMAIYYLKSLRSSLGLGMTETVGEEQIDLLVSSVNSERLKNFPIILTVEDLRKIYQHIFRENG